MGNERNIWNGCLSRSAWKDETHIYMAGKVLGTFTLNGRVRPTHRTLPPQARDNLFYVYKQSTSMLHALRACITYTGDVVAMTVRIRH